MFKKITQNSFSIYRIYNLFVTFKFLLLQICTKQVCDIFQENLIMFDDDYRLDDYRQVCVIDLMIIYRLVLLILWQL